MSQETISVVYTPIGTPGQESWHGTLLYTNAAGQSFYVGGTRSNQTLTQSQVQDPTNILQAEGARISGGLVSSPYGSLIAISGTVGDAQQQSYGSTWFTPSNPTVVLSTGTDLSAKWSTIVDAASQINALGLPYAPVTQNSNSVWCTAASAGNISVPLSDAGLSTFWVPGCPNILPTSYTPPIINPYGTLSISNQTGSNGTSSVSIQETTPSGQVAYSTVLADNATKSINYEQTTQYVNGQTVASIAGQGDVANLSNATVTVTSNVSATINGTNDNIVVAAAPNGGTDSIRLSNGAVDTITGQFSGNISASYGTINFGANTSANVLGTNESMNGGTSDNVSMQGTALVFNGNGATLAMNGGALAVNGSDTIDMTSGVDLTASHCTIVDTGFYQTNDVIMGSYDNFTNASEGLVATIGGTYDIGLVNSDTLNFLGDTTGDTGTGGSNTTDTPNPDSYPFDPSVCMDDPIVLNLTGAKVTTQNLTTSTAYFDIQNTGTLDHTGWGTAGEGYLVYDPNNTNKVVNDQSLVASFASLKALDSNGDGVLNSQDAAWASLKVWVDASGNGTFVAGSLQTVSSLGIASINVNALAENVNQNNNTLLGDSTFTWNSGAVGDIAAVDFNFHASTVHTVVAPPIVRACVHVKSSLPGGLVAEDVTVGATLQLADEVSLAAHSGEVSHSKIAKSMGVRITTTSGISLVCSVTAPIPTPTGLILAPNLLGLNVPVRIDDATGTRTAWEVVATVESVGEIDVQHITVGDKCFWAGERPDAYILHHNLKQMLP